MYLLRKNLVTSALIGFMLLPLGTFAQISQNVYQQLPDSLKPRNREKISFEEASLITALVSHLHLNNKNQDKELDQVCAIVIANYTRLNSKKAQIKHLIYITNYWSNKYTFREIKLQSSLDSAQKYNARIRKLIGSDTKLYKAELGEYYMGQVWIMNGKEQYAEAYKNTRKAMEIYEEKQDYVYLATLGTFLAYMYMNIKLYPQSLAWSDSAFKYNARIPAERKNATYAHQTVTILLNKAVSWISIYSENRKQESMADSAFKLLTAIRRDTSYSIKFKPMNLFLLSQLSYYQGKYEKGVAYADSALSLQDNASLASDIVGSYQFKGLSLIKLKRKKEGLALLRKISPDAGGYQTEEIPELLYKHEKSMGNTAAALVYLEQFLKFKTASQLAKNKGEIFEWDQKYNVATRDAEINNLKSDKVINMLIIGLLAVIAIFITILYLIRRRSNKREIDRMVRQMDDLTESQIQSIEHHKIEAKRNERKQLGQQLHDDLASSIATCTRYLRLKSDEESEVADRSYMLQMSDLMDDCYQKVRNTAHDFFLIETDDQYLDRINDYVSLSFAGTGIIAELNHELSGVNISPETKTAILMILKEAITNIIKHAKASRAEILIYQDPSGIILEVNDNGKGYGRNLLGKNIGLKSIRERVSKMQGQVEFLNGADGGAQITVILPLESIKNSRALPI